MSNNFSIFKDILYHKFMSKQTIIYIIIGLVVITAAYFFMSRSKKVDDVATKTFTKTSVEAPPPSKDIFAVMKTNFGDIKLKLFASDAPKTVANFIKLSESGFYNGVKFHRVIKNFMIQTGDPNSKDDDWSNDGTGGPGYTVPAEIKLKNIKGAIATARLGDQVNPQKSSSGSQFFINTVDNAFLDGGYTVFGQVVEGMDNVLKIENVATDKARGDHPIDDVIIESIDIIKN